MKMVADISVVVALIIAVIGIMHIASQTRDIQQGLFERQAHFGPVIDHIADHMDKQDALSTVLLKNQNEILSRIQSLPVQSCH